jgi:uncharacterized metal-binding protein YceD (DUF177 family)
MSGRREFEIAFVGLKPGDHEFSYEIDEKFFVEYPPRDFSNILAKVRLMLEKNTSFMILKFEVGGTVNLVCDRCGNTIHHQLWEDFEVLVKLVDNPEQMNEEEEDPDVHYIGRGESHLNVESWIYEFILLSIPTHPICDDDEKGESTCNKQVLEMLNKMNDKGEQSQNPIWKDLDKFRNI